MTQKELEIKRFFEEYLKIKREVEDVIELYGRLYSSATGSGSFEIGCSGGGDPGNVVENSVILLEEAKDKIIEKKIRMIEREKLLKGMCEHISDDKTKRTLIESYINGKSRASIARDMECDVQTVTNRKRKGIREIAKHI